MSATTFAVIGLGAAGGFSLEALDTFPSVSVVAGLDPLGEDASAAPLVDGPIFRDLRGLIDGVSFDTAIVATPTTDHVDLVLALLAESARGLQRIWCEKPLATNCKGLEACIRATRQAGVELRTLFHTAFAPEVLWAAARLSAFVESHGPIVQTRSEFLDPYAGQLNRFLPVLGGSWIDSGVNALSVLARFVELDGVSAIDHDPPLACEARFALREDGASATASIRTAWVKGAHRKTTSLTFGDGVRLELSHSEGSARLIDRGDELLDSQDFGKAPLAERYREMLASYLARDTWMLPLEAETQIHACVAAVLEPKVTN